VSDDQLIALPLGGELLAFTRAELDAARTRARDLGLGGQGSSARVEPLVDAAQLAAIMSLPQSWLEEAARQGRIPCVRAGKYVRFEPSAVRAALTTNSGDNDDYDQRERARARKSSRLRT
jgi:hypothetical protein